MKSMNPSHIFKERREARRQKTLRQAQMVVFVCEQCDERVFFNRLETGSYEVFEDKNGIMQQHGCPEPGYPLDWMEKERP